MIMYSWYYGEDSEAFQPKNQFFYMYIASENEINLDRKKVVSSALDKNNRFNYMLHGDLWLILLE